MIRYEDLLDIFWRNHNPARNQPKRQYWNAVFYRDENQRIAAEESKEQIASALGKVETEVIPVKEFTYAEGYHQKYYLTQFRELRAFLEANYPDTKSLADSTVAARLNAALFSGFGEPRRLIEAEIDRYDLPDDLLAMVRERI